METILELRKELTDLIIEYDKKLRENLRIESYYNEELGGIISELSVLDGQIIICNQALKMDESDLDLDEIIKNVKQIKNNVKQGLEAYGNKRRDFKAVIDNLTKYSEADLAKLEEDYENLVKRNHPALILYIPEPHDKAWRYLRSSYLLNDCEAFNTFTHNEVLLNVDDISYTKEQSEEVYIEKYKEFIQSYKRELEKLHSYDEKFATLKATIEDDMLLARNETNIRSRIYAAKDKVVELVNQCYNTFPAEVDFKLE